MPAYGYTGFLKVVYVWQTLITGTAAVVGGLVAYVAGRIQANATREAANRQIAALAHKDRLQAQGIAVAIYPDIINLATAVKNARAGMDEIIEDSGGKLIGQTVANQIQLNTGLFAPEALDRNYAVLYLLGDVAGWSCLTLVTMLYQHFGVVNELASRMMVLQANEWPTVVRSVLEPRLTSLEHVVAECKAALEPIRDGQLESR